jgi:tRNA-uridine 2-sulfurtransferase
LLPNKLAAVSSSEKILVAMSGGVDSSVAALLLRQAGNPIEGAYMKNWINEQNIIGNCPWQQDVEDARAVADRLKIPFRVVNFMDQYRERIVDYLIQGYRNGITPNPDVMCNREVKFGALLVWAKELGFEAVATGHYARRIKRPDGSWDILEGLDKNKDQSYFLALLTQSQVAAARFPVGELHKTHVRKIASEFRLATATKKDSQGICFIGQVKMSDFLRTFVPDKPGPIVDRQGKILGEHKGLHLYTLGQRKGVRVPSNTRYQAYVVVEKRIHSNELVIAFDRADAQPLYARRCKIANISFTNRHLPAQANIAARPRYRARAGAVEFRADEENTAVLLFSEPQRAITPGQICALYDGETLLGGGIFEEVYG